MKSPLLSPLKQDNLGQLRPRPLLTTRYEALFQPNLPPQPPSSFHDLFCLDPDPHELVARLEQLSLQDLLGSYRSSIADLFTNAVRLLRSDDDVVQRNVVETLITLLRNVLTREYSAYSLQVSMILVGSMDARSDAVFTDLVSAIDLIISNTAIPGEIRHRTLQLALVIVASVDQESLNAYFLRRDLFSTLVCFMDDPATSPFAFESALLLGLLANFKRYESRNPYLVRLGDLVSEPVMDNIIVVITSICRTSRESYTDLVDDSRPSFVATLTSLVASLAGLVLGGGLSLPPVVSSSVKGKEREHVDESGKPESAESTRESSASNVLSTPPRPAKPPRPTTPLRIEAKNPFVKLPPEMLVILLPLYDLLTANPNFTALVFSDPDGNPSPLPPALISLSSYVLTHGSTSTRARAYARLSLALLGILLDEGEDKLMTPHTGENVRMCRQRLPMLPYHADEGRPLVLEVLDCTLGFLRHNLRKGLDVEAYLIALKLCLRAMQQLRTQRRRLEYDWVPLWRALLSLSNFLLTNLDKLRAHSEETDDLISQIFIVLSFPCYWGDSFLTTQASGQLYYELLHSESIFTELSDALGITSYASPLGSPAPLLHATFKLPTSPLRTSRMTFAPPSAFKSTECVSNIQRTISFFKLKLADHRALDPGGEEIEAEEVMRVIEDSLERLELIDCAVMEDTTRLEGREERYFEGLVGVVCRDVLRIVPV